MAKNNRDDFSSTVAEALKKRAAYICSNPKCKKMTVAPSEAMDEKVIYIGRAAHICAAAKNGPRYDEKMTEEERSSINNAIFLCSNCADMVDDNKGVDFPAELLKQWKNEHEKWIIENLNKPFQPSLQKVVVNVASSYNQSGGITANQVNIGSIQRSISPESEILFLKEIKNFPKKEIYIRALLFD